MQNILFLAHRIPYPPNKGDKIRSFHFLQALAEHFNVYLGTFIDDEEDWRYCDQLKEYCREVFCLPLRPSTAKLKSLRGLLTGKALSLPYYHNQKMQAWAAQMIEQHAIDNVVIFSSVMAQFVVDRKDIEIIADFVDVDSDKWRQYAQKKCWPESWIYRRESRRLLQFEKQVAARAKVTAFVSPQEAELFKQLAPECRQTIVAVNNGVDIDYFNPDKDLESPYRSSDKAIVFTGAMDYWANADAVIWFAHEVFPKILAQDPDAMFYIVGSKPGKDVLKLGEHDNIVVTGRVEDIRPYLAHAAFVAAPLRIARGIQNKVLEAMAMKKTVIATAAALEGIPDFSGQDVWLCDDADKFAEQACRLLSKPVELLSSPGNRAFVEARFSWRRSGEQLTELINS
ncbi:TIGR03087 family PEP-CTERM/XrtA system glycosyltransferase [Methylomarinum sp. Ch1-1]|uniref:TIGR03087 family PEP-CTERM/XrtA system glycosyltransferase n=1 Tax=Methylomarinum roseum TaxID=3067653 RepID=A0AAU7NPG3_9GAMM|nr:TIGR03087 family PEP-CTERM/XrtA system glycosyltransferase [Methylomarinum sp. Ch1-1]MDP4521258.1 TIGR03087 family PEP-CTERM/XrtA system glycosyltransferase [Methylomarinum sp. Ch1-1]